MKQIIIFLLVIILLIVGFKQYQQYQRFNAEISKYQPNTEIDINFFDQTTVQNYYTAIEDLNNYVKMQFTANDIDVKAPTNDDDDTKQAVKIYANKLGYVGYLEQKLIDSKKLKAKGFSNSQIQQIENQGLTVQKLLQLKQNDAIKKLFDPCVKLYNGENNPLIFEVQKILNKIGYKIQIDGVYRVETLNAIKAFEAKNNLMADGYLDALTIDYLLAENLK